MPSTKGLTLLDYSKSRGIAPFEEIWAYVHREIGLRVLLQASAQKAALKTFLAVEEDPLDEEVAVDPRAAKLRSLGVEVAALEAIREVFAGTSLPEDQEKVRRILRTRSEIQKEWDDARDFSSPLVVRCFPSRANSQRWSSRCCAMARSVSSRSPTRRRLSSVRSPGQLMAAASQPRPVPGATAPPIRSRCSRSPNSGLRGRGE